MRASAIGKLSVAEVQQCQSVRTTRPRPTRRRAADGDVLECLSVNDGRVARSGCGRRARIPVLLPGNASGSTLHVALSVYSEVRGEHLGGAPLP